MGAITGSGWLALGLVSTMLIATGCAAEQPEHALPNALDHEQAGGSGGTPAVVSTAGSSGSVSAQGGGGAPPTIVATDDAGTVAPEAGETTDAGGASDAPPVSVDHGKEYLWIDQTFHWTQTADTNVANVGPHNWYADNGVDYYNGKVEFRVTVTAKADATPVWHELCQWQNSLGDADHVCLHCLALYTKPGEYTCETTAAAQGGPPDYHNPFVAVQNRVKDGTSGRGTDLTTENKGLPIDYHYTVVIVPAGQTFSGWGGYKLAPAM
jgi:hypothetical protein